MPSREMEEMWALFGVVQAVDNGLEKLKSSVFEALEKAQEEIDFKVEMPLLLQLQLSTAIQPIHDWTRYDWVAVASFFVDVVRRYSDKAREIQVFACLQYAKYALRPEFCMSPEKSANREHFQVFLAVAYDLMLQGSVEMPDAVAGFVKRCKETYGMEELFS
mmetsp:Transcript_11836/g.31965  ORF Transcript_11836/g.31965 Transcript_11836/m.31965 type:complete len:162 (-) Transcript_11836:4864-5349(-)